MNSGNKKRSWKLWPILGFWSNWSQDRLDLAPGVLLVKPDDKAMEMIQEEDSRLWTSLWEPWKYEWLLSISLPDAVQEIPATVIGLDLVKLVEHEYIESVLTTLRLAGSGRVGIPCSPFEAPNAEGAPDLTALERTETDPMIIDEPRLPEFNTKPLDDSDLDVFTDLWEALLKLRGLDEWRKLVFSEEFAAHILDAQARRGALRGAENPLRFAIDNIELVLDSEEYQEIKEKCRKEGEYDTEERLAWKALACYFQAVQNGSIAFDDENELVLLKYTNLVKDTFEKHQQQTDNRTRLGRAISMLGAGIELHMSPLHSFLSMCIVLETLYCIESGETAHKMAVRLAKVMCPNSTHEEREELYRKVKKLYNVRSGVVHGTKMFDKLKEEENKGVEDAAELARLSIVRIMRDSCLFAIFTSEDKNDETVRDFFMKLDLL